MMKKVKLISLTNKLGRVKAMKNHRRLLISTFLGLIMLMFAMPAQAAILEAKSINYTFSSEIWDRNYTAFNYTAPPGYYIMSINGTSIFGADSDSNVHFDIYVDGVIAIYYGSSSFSLQDMAASNIRIITNSWGASDTYNGKITLGCDVADNATLIQARDAANAANTAADQARTAANTAGTNALNAYNSVYNANGNTITAVRDSGGTVLYEARQAKTNSQNASTNALNAYNTAQTVNTKIDSLFTAVTNIQNNMGVDTSPPVVEITTVSGALATSAGFIRTVINASDNVSTFFEYSLDGTAYHPLPTDGVVDLPVINPGTNLITLWVKDEAGNVGRDSITIRKLGR